MRDPNTLRDLSDEISSIMATRGVLFETRLEMVRQLVEPIAVEARKAGITVNKDEEITLDLRSHIPAEWRRSRSVTYTAVYPDGTLSSSCYGSEALALAAAYLYWERLEKN